MVFSLWIFWVILTASFKLTNLLAGFVCAILVAFFAQSLLAEHFGTIGLSLWQAFRLIIYFPFLLKEIVKANIDVAKRVLNPRLPIDPQIIKFKFSLKEKLPQVTLANSITLTPGTLTIDIQDDEYYIHCLAQEHAEGIFEETLQNHVIWLYEGKQIPRRSQ